MKLKDLIYEGTKHTFEYSKVVWFNDPPSTGDLEVMLESGQKVGIWLGTDKDEFMSGYFHYVKLKNGATE